MSVPAWAVRGAKCVCVKREAWRPLEHFERAPCVPVYGDIYTVRQVVSLEGGVYLALDQVAGPYCFAVCNFRPLVDDQAQERDVAHFRHHLTQNNRVDA